MNIIYCRDELLKQRQFKQFENKIYILKNRFESDFNNFSNSDFDKNNINLKNNNIDANLEYRIFDAN